jgi:hypothetical protein
VLAPEALEAAPGRLAHLPRQEWPRDQASPEPQGEPVSAEALPERLALAPPRQEGG